MNHLLSARLRKSANIIRQNDRLARIKIEKELLRLVTAAQAVVQSRPSSSRPSSSRPSSSRPSSSRPSSSQQVRPERKPDADRERKLNALVEFGTKNSTTITKNLRKDFSEYIHRSVVKAAQSMGEVFNDDRSPLADAYKEPLEAILNVLREDGKVDLKAISAARSSASKNMKKLEALKRFTGNASDAPTMYHAALSLAIRLQRAQDPKLIGRAKISSRGMENYNEVVLGVLKSLKKVRELKSSLNSAEPDQLVVDRERRKLGAEAGIGESLSKIKELKDRAAKAATEAEKEILEKVKELYSNNNKGVFELLSNHIKEAYSPTDSASKKLLDKNEYSSFYYMTRPPKIQREDKGGILHASDVLEAHEGKLVHKAYVLYLTIARVAEVLRYALSRWSKVPSDRREEEQERLLGRVKHAEKSVKSLKSALSLVSEEAEPLELTNRKEEKPEEEAPAKEEKPEEEAPAKEEKPEEEAPAKEEKPEEEAPAKEEKPPLKDPDIPQDTPMPEGEAGKRAVDAIQKQMDAIEEDVQKQLDPMVDFMLGEASRAYKNANPDKEFDIKEVLKENIDDFYSGGVVDTAINSSNKGEYINARKMKNTMEDFSIDELDDDRIGKTIIRMYRTITISARILGILQYLGGKPEVILTSSWAQDKITKASKRLNAEHRRFQALKRALVSIRPGNNKVREKKKKNKQEAKEASVKK